MLDLAINGGTVVDERSLAEVNVGVSGSSVAVLSQDPLEGLRTIDASGCYVLPGAIDAHVHMQPRTPGQSSHSFIEWADDFSSGSRSAACGGVTTIVDFAVQEQEEGASALSAVENYLEIAGQTSAVDFSLHAGLTQPSQSTIDEIPDLIAMGVTSFKFFRTYRQWGIYVDLGFMDEAFAEISRGDGTACVHCEQDEILSFRRERYFAEGRERDLRYHALSRPAIAEEIAIDEIAALARLHDTRAYVVHLNSALGLAAVKRAQAAGTRLQSEVGLHFLFFTEEVFTRPDAALFFMTPPFRTEADIASLWDGLTDGSIDWIGTDHSPHLRAEKLADPRFSPSKDGLEFAIPPGFTGVEEMLPLVYTAGVAKGKFDLPRLVQLLSANPSRSLGLTGKGSLAPGADADIVVYDPRGVRQLSIDGLQTKADYTIYEGIEVHGRVRDTFLRGGQIVRDGAFVGEPDGGQFIARVPGVGA